MGLKCLHNHKTKAKTRFVYTYFPYNNNNNYYYAIIKHLTGIARAVNLITCANIIIIPADNFLSVQSSIKTIVICESIHNRLFAYNI